MLKRITIGIVLVALALGLGFAGACGTTRQEQRGDEATGPREIDYSQYLAPGAIKRKVAVVYFEDKTPYGRGRLGGVALEALVGHLTRSQGFIVVERAQIDKVIAEHQLQMSGLTAGVDALQLGEMLKADALVLGAVLQFGIKTEGHDYVVSQSKTQTAETVVQVRVIDVQSGRVLEAITGRGVAATTAERVLGVGSSAGYDETLAGRALDAAVAETVVKLLTQLSKDVSWSAYIAEVQADGTVIITAGSAANIEPGDALEVFQPGDEVRDPNSGEIIGRKPATRKGLVRVTKILGENIALAERVEGRGLDKGDLLMNPVHPAVAR